MLRKVARVVAVLLCTAAFVLLLGPARRLLRRHSSDPATRLLEEADEKAWLNNWIAALPLYQQAEQICKSRHDKRCELYARASQIPVTVEHTNLYDQIVLLNGYLAEPAARDYDTRLRILSVRGMLEVNYDANMTAKTYAEIERMAWRHGHFLIASRAIGERGIADFMIGDIASAKTKVVYAWMTSKLFRDRAAQIRYASVFAEGLVKTGRYVEAHQPINEAIHVAAQTPGVAYPSMAKTALIEALTGEGKYADALSVLAEDEQKAKEHQLKGHLFDVASERGDILLDEGKTDLAIDSYKRAIAYAQQLSYWRGLNVVGGPLARALATEGRLDEALAEIQMALDANTHISEELYFAPRNLAIKAEILRQMGRIAESNHAYDRSVTLIDALLASAPSPSVERNLISDLNDVYTGYFTSLFQQGRTADAFEILEKAHGRIETQALQHHTALAPHPPTESERELSKLNVKLIGSNEPSVRSAIERSIYETELRDPTSRLAGLTSIHPVKLAALQRTLGRGELLLDYVLAEPVSYVMAITSHSANSYSLPGRKTIDAQVKRYLKGLQDLTGVPTLSSALFDMILKPVQEYTPAQSVIVVSAGSLQSLPFSALWDGQHYAIQSHAMSFEPSATVLALLRSEQSQTDDHTFLGVAAWTGTKASWVDRFLRGGGPELDRLTPLPASLNEVSSIAADFPRPTDILAGSTATETEFKKLPLYDYRVIHLALHGYVDPLFPDRSALVFAPQSSQDDGLLQVREIQNLHLNASLVTLSACDSAVGPLQEAGVNSLSNAFLDAGAKTVVSSLWEVDDHATAELMIAFYTNLARGEAKSEALRQATLHVIDGVASQPFYWAAFQLSGEPASPLTQEELTNSR